MTSQEDVVNDARYSSFSIAAHAAFSELDAGGRELAFVVPAPDRMWRVIYSVNREALKSEEQIIWVEMWENLAKVPPENRELSLRSYLEDISATQHALGARALHDLEFSDDTIIRQNRGVGRPSTKNDYVADHTGYGKGGENFEHEGKGDVMNYSGVHDDTHNSMKEHEDWNEGYDY